MIGLRGLPVFVFGLFGAMTAAEAVDWADQAAAQKNRVNIVLIDAVPSRFQNGRASSCTLVANVYNGTKHHINALSFKITGWSTRLMVGEMNANSSVDSHRMLDAAPPGGMDCVSRAAFAAKPANKAVILDCLMPNVAEGDCQEMVSVSTSMDVAALKRIGDFETALGDKQFGPVRQAFAAAGLDAAHPGRVADDLAKLTALLDTLVALDSKSWASTYSRGSMKSVAVESRSADGSNLILSGKYRGESSLVRARIQEGGLTCLQYDTVPDCRAVWLPDVSALN